MPAKATNHIDDEITGLDYFLPEEKMPTKKERDDIIGFYQFFSLFPDEAAAIKFVEDSIWGEFPRCGRCLSFNVYRKENGKPMSHRCRPCRRNFSVRTGTTMAETNLPLHKWLLAIHRMLSSRKGVSALQLQKELEVSYPTAWFLCHRIREAMREDREIMSGIFEIDESWFGPHRNRQHANKRPPLGTDWKEGKVAVIGLRRKSDGKVIAFPVPNTFAETLHKAVTDNVEPGSYVQSDGEMAYRSLPYLGYLHDFVSHSAGEYVRDQVTTNGIESFWALLKRAYVGTFHFMSWKHLHRYVNEATFRNNIGPGNGPRTMAQVLRCMVDRRLTYKELIGDLGVEEVEEEMEEI